MHRAGVCLMQYSLCEQKNAQTWCVFGISSGGVRTGDDSRGTEIASPQPLIGLDQVVGHCEMAGYQQVSPKRLHVATPKRGFCEFK